MNNQKSYQIYCATPELVKIVLNYLESMGYNHTYSKNDINFYKWLTIYPKHKSIGGNSDEKDYITTIDFNTLFSWRAEKKEIVVLNNEYKAEITKDGIKVGCQVFPLDIVGKLVEARDKVIK